MDKRPIKFRAWNVITKTMIDLKKMTPLALNMDTDGLFIPFSDGLPLMQFTGLKDSKKIDIYEGDIVRYYVEEMFFKGEVVGWIEFDDSNGCFRVVHDSTSMGFCAIDISFSQIEIIGNIYENPELLT